MSSERTSLSFRVGSLRSNSSAAPVVMLEMRILSGPADPPIFCFSCCSFFTSSSDKENIIKSVQFIVLFYSSSDKESRGVYNRSFWMIYEEEKLKMKAKKRKSGEKENLLRIWILQQLGGKNHNGKRDRGKYLIGKYIHILGPWLNPIIELLRVGKNCRSGSLVG